MGDIPAPGLRGGGVNLSGTEEQAESPRGGHQLRNLFAATSISVTGDGVLAAAAPLLAASLTSDPFRVGAVSSASYAAWLLVGLPIGTLVDRLPLRRVMATADLARAAILLVLVALITTGHASLWWLTAVVFVLGVGSCFFDPAAQAMIPISAGREHGTLLPLNGRLWTLDTLGRWLVGPPLGAWLFAWGRHWPFLADSISFAASAVLVARLPRDRHPPPVAVPLRMAIRHGLYVLWRQRHLRSAALGMALYNFGWSIANATLVLFATVTLKLTESQFGWVLAAAALGGMIGGRAHHLIGGTHIQRVYASVLLLQAAAWWAVARTEQVAVLIGALIVVGATNTAISAAGGATRQRHSPNGMLGRVSASTRVIGVGAASVGSLIGGTFANRYGLVSPFMVAATVLLASGTWFAMADTH